MLHSEHHICKPVIKDDQVCSLLADLGAASHRNAGESLTPSPVTATHSPRAWNALTISSFCFGVVRANTASLYEHTRSQPRGSSLSSSGPVRITAALAVMESDWCICSK